MVFSVFAGTVALSGSAAAEAGNNADSLTVSPTSGPEGDVTLTATISTTGKDVVFAHDANNDGDIQSSEVLDVVTDGGNDDEDSSDNEVATTVDVSSLSGVSNGDTVTFAVEGEDGGSDEDSNDGDVTYPTTADATADYNVNDGGAPEVRRAVHYVDSDDGAIIEVAFTEDISADNPEFTVRDSDNNVVLDEGSAASTTINNGRLVIDTGGAVVRDVENISLSGYDDAAGNEVDVEDQEVIFSPTTVDTNSAGTSGVDDEAYRGANVTLEGDVGDSFGIQGLDDINTDQTRGTGANSEVYVLDTDNLEIGDYAITNDDASPSTNRTLQLQDLGLEVEADETSFDDNEDVTATVSSDAINRDVDAELVDDTGDEVNETTVTIDGDGEAEANFGTVDADNYTVEVTDVETGVTASSDEFEVVDVGDEEAGFSSSSYSEARGDIVNVTVTLDNTDTATVQFGDNEDDNYNITAEVTDDDDDGVVYVEFNTFLAGSTAAPSNVLTVGDDDEIENYSVGGSFADGQAPGEDVLEASDYDISVASGDKETTVVDDPDNVAVISLQERSTDSAAIWTAPEEDYDELSSTDAAGVVEFVNAGNLTQTNTIANGDTMVVQITANGLEGAFDDTDEYQTASGTGDLFSLEIEEDSAAANADPEAVNISEFDSDNVSVIYADTEGPGADDHYVVINSDSVTDQLEYDDGDGYVANFTVYGDKSANDLADDDENVQDNANIEDLEVNVDTNEDDFVVLGAGDGQEVTGDTNFAPGTELTINIRSDGAPAPFLKQPETIVQSDGTFAAATNFSSENEGANFTVQPRLGGDDIGSDYDGYLVEATEEPTTTEDTETETVEPPTDTETETETETETDAGGMTDTETATMADGTETTTGGSGPGFTAAIALIALVAAALLAVRRNN
jgi:PGF-CTERM protein